MKKGLKKLAAAIAMGEFLSMPLAAYTASDVEAAPLSTIASVYVDKDGSNFQYWNENAPALKALKAYVQDVTNPASPNYIPVEDRIVVSDMDGTFYGELAPTYSEWYLYFHRVLEDKSYHPTPAEVSFAEQCKEAAIKGSISTDYDSAEDHAQANAFEGMTIPEFNKYVHNFMSNTPLDGLSNCTFAEAYYLPMVEVIFYLVNNDFTFFVVTGTDRQLVRQCIADAGLPIPSHQIIGTDSIFIPKDQAFADGMYYTWDKDDVLVRGNYIFTNNKGNKVSNIAREIGKQPVLCFGNSTSDGQMMTYTMANNNKYKSLSFGVLCDDADRDWGGEEKAAKMKKFCEGIGAQTISMRDDWKTIYGYEVEKTEQNFRK